MQIDTRSMRWGITNPGGNSTASSIVEPLPTRLAPNVAPVSTGVTSVGDGVIELASDIPGALAPNSVLFVPFGAGSATNTFTMKIYAWRRTTSGSPGSIWIPFLLCSFTITLGTAPGIAGTDINASQLFATTIVLVTGNANVSNEVVSPGSNVIAHIIADAKGAQYVETRYSTGASATSCNAAYAKV